MNQPRSRVLVSVATYNERENIRNLIAQIFEHLPEADLLVVDDGSPDGTGALVDECAQKDSRIHVLHREGKLGLGTAILDAMRFAIHRDHDFMVNMDADFSHSPADLPKLVEAMESADVVIGSRYVPGGGVVGWSLRRHFMSTMINVYSRLLLGLKARDCSGGYRCYRVSKLREIDFGRIRSKGYSWQEEFLYYCQRAGCRIREVPITFRDRQSGTSKINMKEACTALWVLLLTGLRRLVPG